MPAGALALALRSVSTRAGAISLVGAAGAAGVAGVRVGRAGRRGRRVLGGVAAAAVGGGGDEHGVGEGLRAVVVLAALLLAGGGARNHGHVGGLGLGLLLVHEVEAVADEGPLVPQRPRLLQMPAQTVTGDMIDLSAKLFSNGRMEYCTPVTRFRLAV